MTKASTNGNSAFVNRQEVKIEVGAFSGTATIPVILEIEHLAVYLEETERNLDKNRQAIEAKTELPTEDTMRAALYNQILAKGGFLYGLNIPIISYKDFKAGKNKYPALTMALWEHVNPLIQDAMRLKNS